MEQTPQVQQPTAVMMGYQTLDDNGKVYVRIDSIDFGTFRASPQANIVAYVGSRSAFRLRPYQFKRGESPYKNVWSFSYKNARKSTFVVALYKHRYTKSDSEIGEIELRISGFQLNCVTTQQFTMKSPQFGGAPPQIRLTVHVAEDGAPPFQAPPAQQISPNIEVPHMGCYN